MIKYYMAGKTYTDIRNLLATRLKNARMEKGFSQRDLALLTGLSDKSISAYEKGKVVPPLEVLVKLARNLDKPISYFLEEELDITKNISVTLRNMLDELDMIRKRLLEIYDEIEKIKHKQN